MTLWIAAGLVAGFVAVAAQASSAPVSGKVAEGALFSAKGAQAVIVTQKGLSPQDADVLRQVASTQKYYGAIAISPDEGLMAQPTSVAANFHDSANARAKAKSTCDANRRKSAAACVIVADILPLKWAKGARVQLSTDATAGFGQVAPGKRVVATSPSTGHWGAGTAGDAALRACAAMGGAKDCAVVVKD